MTGLTQTVSFTLNGELKTLEIEANWTLLFVLREVLGLTGTKYGCGTNDCGVCKVLVDSEPVNSCVYLMRKIEGRTVLTIEGIDRIPACAVIQQSFIDAHAVQCGFCTPGMIVSTLGLLLKKSAPTEEEIRHALRENLCRCTGYVNIVKAVQLIVERTGGGGNGTWKI